MNGSASLPEAQDMLGDGEETCKGLLVCLDEA